MPQTERLSHTDPDLCNNKKKQSCKQLLMKSQIGQVRLQRSITSYDIAEPDTAGCLRLTLHTAPFAERMQTVRGP